MSKGMQVILKPKPTLSLYGWTKKRLPPRSTRDIKLLPPCSTSDVKLLPPWNTGDVKLLLAWNTISPTTTDFSKVPLVQKNVC